MILRWISLSIWAIVMIVLLPATGRVLRGRARYYDMLWALLAAIAAMILLYRVRAIAQLSSASADIGLQLYSIVLGIVVLWVARSYARTRDD